MFGRVRMWDVRMRRRTMTTTTWRSYLHCQCEQTQNVSRWLCGCQATVMRIVCAQQIDRKSFATCTCTKLMCENRKMSAVTVNFFVIFRCVRIDSIFFSWKNRSQSCLFFNIFGLCTSVTVVSTEKYSIFPRDRNILILFVASWINCSADTWRIERSRRNEYKCFGCEWRWRWRRRSQKSDENEKGKIETDLLHFQYDTWTVLFSKPGVLCRMTRWSMVRLCSTQWMTLPWQSWALPITETKVCRFHPAKTIAML